MAVPTRTTLLRNARLLSASQPQGVPADLLLAGDRIQAVAACGALAGPFDEVVDLGHHLVMPGLVNAHTHSHGSLARGLVDDRTALEGFLACSGALNGGRGADDLHLSAQLTAVELLHKGVTACIDMAAELPVPTVDGLLAIGRAYDEAGLRAVLCPMLADRSLYAAYPALLATLPAELQAEAAALRLPDWQALLAPCHAAQAAWPFDRTVLQLGIGPTIPMHCSDELLAGSGRLSRQHGVPLQVHLLESRVQAVWGRDRAAEGPVQRLQRLGCLGPQTTVAHGVWLNDAEADVLRAHGVTLVHNPLSNLRLGSGIAPLSHLLRRGLRVALGTDASNTSDGQNLFEAMRLASYLSRVGSASLDDWVDAEQVLDLATQGGAQALGLADRLGRIAPGQLADLAVIDLQQAHYQPLHHLLRQLVLAETGSAVQRVYVNGRCVLAEGRVLGIDEAALRTRAAAAAGRLAEARAQSLAFARRLLPWVNTFCCEADAGAPNGIQRMLRP